jgi:hypothetical protein
MDGITRASFQQAVDWLNEIEADELDENELRILNSACYMYVDEYGIRTNAFDPLSPGVSDILKKKTRVSRIRELYNEKQYDQMLELMRIQKVYSIIPDMRDGDEKDVICCICFEKQQYMILTECKHVICMDCAYMHRYKHNNRKCPLCKTELAYKKYSTITEIDVLDDLYKNKYYDTFFEKQDVCGPFDNSDRKCTVCSSHEQFMTQTTCGRNICVHCVYLYKIKFKLTECPFCGDNTIIKKHIDG